MILNHHIEYVVLSRLLSINYNIAMRNYLCTSSQVNSDLLDFVVGGG